MDTVVTLAHPPTRTSSAAEHDPIGSPSPSQTDGRKTRAKFAWAIAVGWFAAILLTLALKVDGVKETLTVVISAVGAAGAVLAAFSTHLAKARMPSLTGRAGTTVVCVFLSVELLFSVGWPLLSAYRDGREIDVLDQIVPPHSRGVLPGTEIAVTVPVRRDRAAIALEIEITDHNPGSGVCAPMTTLGVWRANRTVRADPATARRGERVTISAPKTGDRTTIGIDVGNEQSDRNCAVDVRITSARLTNKERQ